MHSSLKRLTWVAVILVIAVAAVLYISANWTFWKLELTLKNKSFQNDLFSAAKSLMIQAPISDSNYLYKGDTKIPPLIQKLGPKQVLVTPGAIGIETSEGYKIICENRSYPKGFAWTLYREDSSGPVEYYNTAEQDAAANP